VIAALFPTGTTPLLAAAIATGTASLWLLLPQSGGAGSFLGRRRGAAGIVLGLAALVGLAIAGRRLGGLGDEAVFQLVSLVAIVGGAATVVTRSPVYSAIWFALALAGVAGVLLVLGAQFLGVATIVVYAGAILVMFLFVLMLAQPAGLAPYDRVSNEPFLSAVTAAVLLGLLTLSIGRLSGPAAEPTAAVAADSLAENHVARLGAELFGRHLVSVEAAGVLLLVALIGAIAVVSRSEAAGREDAR